MKGQKGEVFAFFVVQGEFVTAPQCRLNDSANAGENLIPADLEQDSVEGQVGPCHGGDIG